MIEGRDFAAASTVGARKRQEDDWGTHANPPALEAGAGLLAVVADGMGGMPAGDRASAVALRAFLDSYPALHLPARERLRRALAHANREVGIAAEADPALAGMGCTLVAALFFPDRCEWLSIGDSFLLLCRDGRLERVNPLHNMARELDEQAHRGEITAAEAAGHPDRALLTSAVQGGALDQVAQADLGLAPGDVMLLASDGIATLPDEEIASICAEHADAGARRIAEALIGRIDAAARPGQDNATVIVVCHRLEEAEDTVVVPEDASGEESEEREVSGDGESDGTPADVPDVGTAEGPGTNGPGERPWPRLVGAFLLGVLAATAVWQTIGFGGS